MKQLAGYVASNLMFLSKFVHRLTEEHEIGSNVARQLLHLAMHAEHNLSITRGLYHDALVLDRWWWSTLAYGWFGNPDVQERWSLDEFSALCRTVWGDLKADVTFLFINTWAEDDNNREQVLDGYRTLNQIHNNYPKELGTKAVFPIAPMSVNYTHEYIVNALHELDLVTN